MTEYPDILHGGCICLHCYFQLPTLLFDLNSLLLFKENSVDDQENIIKGAVMKRKHKRKRIYFKKIALYRSIFSFFITAGAGFAVLTVLYLVFSLNILSLALETNSVRTGQENIPFLSYMLGNHWIYILVGSFFLILISTYFTHKFAGPLYRFEKTLERMIDGDVGFRIRLRKGDECQHIADKINQLNSKLSMNIKTMKIALNEIDNLYDTIEEDSGMDKEYLMQAVSYNNRLKKIISEFTVS